MHLPIPNIYRTLTGRFACANASSNRSAGWPGNRPSWMTDPRDNGSRRSHAIAAPSHGVIRLITEVQL